MSVCWNHGDVLWRLRHHAGLTRGALARRSGVSVRTIRAIERGRRRPTGATRARLAAAFDMSREAFDALMPLETGIVPLIARARKLVMIRSYSAVWARVFRASVSLIFLLESP